MEQMLDRARDLMRASHDRADAHRQFVTMFAVAGMMRESAWHEKQAASESHMADVWAGFYSELVQ